MKVLHRNEQSKVLRYIIDIFEALVKHDDIESADAIIAAYRIAAVVGGKEMVKKLEVKNEDSILRSGRMGRRRSRSHSTCK